MTAPIIIVGSGPSAVHCALTLLERGHRVCMLDVGRVGPQPPLPDATYQRLKSELEDPAAYLLGEDLRSVVTPDRSGEYYGFPPDKDHVFADLDAFRLESSGFAPLTSFAQGGLAEAWTGGVYAFTDAELDAFPFGYDEIGPHYDTVARRIGICGAEDDLARFFPTHAHLQPPLELDEHAARLLDRYGTRRAKINQRHGTYVGRSRYATLSRPQDGRPACTHLGRCLWGCPTGAFYTPRATLAACESHPTFTYLSGRYVTHVRFEDPGGARAVIARNLETEEIEEHPAERVVLAAGTLPSSRIFLESFHQAGREAPVLSGLMDNRQILMPFVNLAMIRRPHDPDTYQYHQLAMGLSGPTARDAVHVQVTTLKTALIHPIVQSLPFDLRTSTFFFRNLHAALGLLNINFNDARRPTNTLALASGRLKVRYAPPSGERRKLRRTMRTFRRVLWQLGCVVPPGMTHARPMGASVHYAGVLPMTARAAPLTTSETGESRDVPNLFFADGTTMPSIPAKNLTLTLMANASRIATEAF